MTSPGRYCYIPLQSREIRLLHVKPGDGPQIQLSLVNFSLEDELSYEALSYTWGDSSNTSGVICNETGHTLDVTKNCEAALRVLRKDNMERILWIEAICIDQSNKEEQSHQILYMPNIYSRAKRVIAFLGEASNDSELVMNFILDDRASIGRGHRPPVGESLQRAMDQSLERAYFGRVWIIQEILLASDITIVLGDKAAAWADLSRSVFYVDANKRLHLGETYRNLVPAVMFWRDRSTLDRPNSLLQFLHATRLYKSSDPRDKVYALLAMTPEKDEPDVAPDYTLSHREIFLSVAKFLLIHHNNLDVLCHCQGTPPSYDLPSWAPDWSVCRVSKALGLPNTSPRPYKADGRRPASIVFEDPETLVLRGRPIDTVSKIGSIYYEGAHPTVTLRQWDAMLSSATRDPTSQLAKSSFLETLIAYPTYRVPNPYENFHSAWRSMMLDQKVLEREDLAAATIMQNLVNEKCHGRCFFVTEKGYTGIGPGEMRPNHEVAVLLGGQVPFVLSKSDGDQYKFIGECYLHGFMNGEGMDDDKDILDQF
ncbi:HET-domain-containing protein [Xylariaceae sp. AK1471]|nr:HET-domain-containing protein [Xylariaceae sp. AK1471]